MNRTVGSVTSRFLEGKRVNRMNEQVRWDGSERRDGVKSFILELAGRVIARKEVWDDGSTRLYITDCGYRANEIFQYLNALLYMLRLDPIEDSVGEWTWNGSPFPFNEEVEITTKTTPNPKN